MTEDLNSCGDELGFLGETCIYPRVKLAGPFVWLSGEESRITSRDGSVRADPPHRRLTPGLTGTSWLMTRQSRAIKLARRLLTL